jgi:hypothetical protein
MSYSRLSIASDHTRLTYQFDKGETRAWQAKKTRVGARKTQWERDQLIIQIPKVRQHVIPEGNCSLVVGLDFWKNNLWIHLMNKGSRSELAKGVAFDPISNSYIEGNSARLNLGPEILIWPGYEIGSRTDYRGDRLILRGLSRADGKREYGPEVVINLTALFAFSSLIFHSDGRVMWREHEVGHFERNEQELAPLVWNGGCYGDGQHAFATSWWEMMHRWAPYMDDLQSCEEIYNSDRGGSEVETVIRFKDLLAALPR